LGDRWINNGLKKIMKQACSNLGVNADVLGVEAHLYKLVCYEKGGHFKVSKYLESGAYTNHKGRGPPGL
jgi:hypothetical protein